MKVLIRCLFVLFAFVLLVACGEGIVVIPTQSVNVNTGASPSPAPPGVPGAFDSVAVEIFEHPGCANAPARGELVVRLGCTARVTATPKARGLDVPSTAHGAVCNWFLNGQKVEGIASSPVVQIAGTANPFNVNAKGLAAGTFTLEAEVQGVRSGAKVFTVQ